MKIDHFDIKVTVWQRIYLDKPMFVSDVKEYYIDAECVNEMFEDGTASHYENLVDDEEYDYTSAEYEDEDGNYKQIKLRQ